MRVAKPPINSSDCVIGKVHGSSGCGHSRTDPEVLASALGIPIAAVKALLATLRGKASHE